MISRKSSAWMVLANPRTASFSGVVTLSALVYGAFRARIRRFAPRMFAYRAVHMFPPKRGFEPFSPPGFRSSVTNRLSPGSNPRFGGDRKSTRLNSSHLVISYAVFCLKKKKLIRGDD